MALRRRRAGSATVYKLCSLLLLYPDAELLGAAGELRAAVAELPRSRAAAALGEFLDWWSSSHPLELAEHYVETFDLDKRSGLYLTFYGKGDKRERGQALVRLKRMYRASGLPLEGTELPDYLPVMLEFAAAAPAGRGELVLREHRAALELVRIGLHERDDPYARVLDAVCLALGEASAADLASVRRLIGEGPPQELVGLEPFAPPDVMPGMEARR
jgi:nitrate reductase molybdenum cofactor assembly chaperone NarJ/NarW